MTQPGSPEFSGAEFVREMARNFWYSAILRAAIKLDVFALLEDNPLRHDQVAQSIGASPRYTQAFLDCCAVLGLLEVSDGKFSNSANASGFLVKGKDSYVGDHAVHHTNTWASWGRLDEVVRQGKTLLPFETGFVDADTYWNDYMIGQHNRATSGQSRQLVQSLDLKDKRNLIDLGGGAASYSIALCEANPQLKSVVIDQKEPLVVAKSFVEQSSSADRITLLEGNFFDTDIGTGYDVCLISGVVLISPEEDCRKLFKLAFDALESGGLVVVQDYMRLEDNPARKRLDTLEDLYVLVVFNPGAGDREGAEVMSWLEEAGFINPKSVPLPTQLGLITAEKPPDL
ncbi:MAG: methyltransferase domain-containing protein [SAR202 cluster bacterium]|nr:methyltransferase domain-containing protein [SAR202 cluster bacterium]